ncbi:hypothetical protein ULF88_15775 [Halopseudomonas pachastrellae]|nr:hypothetical protein [Halopseudomonas pachastrellae]
MPGDDRADLHLGAPWIRVPATDPHERDQRIGQIVLEAMRQRLASEPAPRPVYGWQAAQRDYLGQLDYSRALDKDTIRSNWTPGRRDCAS